ncbi:Nucleus export protein brr6 [Leucoagaricus sp. SymC.cos]|nr:Nucleus export protein brr6 [Leucoagaricus sp. SymC.cos]
MDFEWTNRPGVKPVWSSKEEDPSTPRKRSIEEVYPPQPGLGAPQAPVFGSTYNQNVPFIFQSPRPLQTNPSYPWAPPLNSAANKNSQAEESRDVDMSESSPARDPEPNEKENGRPMALGALRRVYHRRHGSRISKSSRSHPRAGDEDEGFDSGIDEGDELGPITRNTSNHYTLNMPAPAPAPSQTPYVLLGYLQFLFNLSLISLFLYLAIQFIITIQRDVEHRVSEYSQDIVQEIAMCALQYRNNLCETSPIPAMIQQCAKWEACMNRDPAVVGRAKVSAELIAEVVNGFVEPISWKTLIFSLSSLSFLTIFVNALLSLYRTRHQPNHTPHSNQAYPIAPGAPFPHPYPTYPGPGSNSWSRAQPEENPETPARRRKLEGGNLEKIK